MQVRQMNYLLAVVECGSFRLAAQQLFMSQPALSQSIRALEEELGFPLLERRPDGVAPTQMGEVVYRDVKGLLAAMEEKTQAWKTQYARQCACAGTVRLGYVSDTWHLVERARARLEQSHPNLRLRLTEERTGSLLEGLAGGQLDLILSDYIDAREKQALATAAEKGLTLRPLCRDAYRIAVSAQGPLGDQTQLTEEQARALPLARFSGGDEAAELFFETWFDRAAGLEFNSFEKMVGAALSGQAVSVLPVRMVRSGLIPNPQDLRFLTVEGFDVPFTHYLARRAGTCSPGMQGAIESLVWAVETLVGPVPGNP